MPTVGELVRWAGSAEFTLAAGASGLAREITRVVRFRARRRDIQLQAGDLVLWDGVEWQRQFGQSASNMLDTVGKLQVAATLVSGPAFETATWRSDHWRTPILLASELQLDYAETLLTSWLAHTQSREEQQASDLRAEMLRSGHRLEAHDVMKRVVQFAGKPVMLHDADGSAVLACQPAARPRRQREIDAANKEICNLVNRLIRQKQLPFLGVEYQELPSYGLAMLSAPVREARGATHYLSTVGRPTEFAHRDRIVLLAAADAWATLEHDRGVDPSEQDLPPDDGAELIRLLLLGRMREACRVADRAGYDLKKPWMGIAVGTEAAEVDLCDHCHDVADVLCDHQALLRVEDGCIVGLLPVTNDLANYWQRREMVQRWQAGISTKEPAMRLGYSAVHAQAMGAHRALVEARHALALGLNQDTPLRVFGYAAACVRELAVGGQGNPLLKRLYDWHLSPLISNDHLVEHDLLRTLSVHLETACRTTQTAEVLGLHRNTVLYRLERLVELTGVDLEDADTRLLLQLLLRAVDVRDPDFGWDTPDGALTGAGLDLSTFELVWFRRDPADGGLVADLTPL